MESGRTDRAPIAAEPGRLTGLAEWFWYAAAAVGYIALGVWHKWLLNLFIGPLWLVAVVCAGPAIVDRTLRAFVGRRP